MIYESLNYKIPFNVINSLQVAMGRGLSVRVVVIMTGTNFI